VGQVIVKKNQGSKVFKEKKTMLIWSHGTESPGPTIKNFLRFFSISSDIGKCDDDAYYRSLCGKCRAKHIAANAGMVIFYLLQKFILQKTPIRRGVQGVC
jgi:hypothetical protein